jgi:uncharacterized protein
LLVPHFLAPLLERASPGGLVLENTRTGARLATWLECAFDSAGRRRGLLGRDGLPAGAALILAPCGAIHTFFMRFPIDVLFANRDGRVLRALTVRPWRIGVSARGFAAIELPAGVLAESGTAAGDRLAVVRPPGGETRRPGDLSSGPGQTIAP